MKFFTFQILCPPFLDSTRVTPLFLKTHNKQMASEQDSVDRLESMVDGFVLENDYSSAVDTQVKLIRVIEKQHVRGAEIRLFHLLLAIEHIDKAIEKGIECAWLCIQERDYTKALFMYSITIALIMSYDKERVSESRVIALCYELCLCQVVSDGGDPLKQLSATLGELVKQFPQFAGSRQYKRLEQQQFDLLTAEASSPCEKTLLALIKH